MLKRVQHLTYRLQRISIANVFVPQNMPGRMKRESQAVQRALFTVFLSRDVGVVIEPDTGQELAILCDEIMFMSTVGVVGMSVGYNGVLYRAPRVDIKIALAAI